MHQHLPHPRRGLDRVSTSDSQSSPHGRPSQHAPANRTHPGTAEYQGSLIIADQSHSRAHIDSSVHLVPNPISASDSRISPRKQAVRQTASIRTHPRTAESRGPQTMTSQPPNRPRLPSRTKTDLDGQSPNQSTEKAGTACGRNLQSCGSREIPKLPQYSTPNRPIIPPPPADHIGFRHPIPESVRGYDQNCGGRSNGRQPTGHKNNNPAYFTEGCHSH